MTWVRGSAGNEDPFIGTVELAEGTYFMAIAGHTRLPEPLDQFFNRNTTNPLLRLEPIEALERIASQRDFGAAVLQDPTQPTILFDNDSIEEYAFDDVLLYVNTGASLFIVNPFTGANYGRVGDFIDEINDIAFRNNGELFAYSDYFTSPPGDDEWEYVRIDTGTAAVTDMMPGAPGGNMLTFHDVLGEAILEVISDDGLSVEAITIREFLGQESGFFVGNRPIDRTGNMGRLEYYQNILYEFDPTTGDVVGPVYDRDEQFPGAGTGRREIGFLDTEPPANAPARQLGISNATEVNSAGVAVARLADGDAFTLDDGTDTFTFELDQGFTITATGGLIRDQDTMVVNTTVFEFNVGPRVDAGQCCARRFA